MLSSAPRDSDTMGNGLDLSVYTAQLIASSAVQLSGSGRGNYGLCSQSWAIMYRGGGGGGGLRGTRDYIMWEQIRGLVYSVSKDIFPLWVDQLAILCRIYVYRGVTSPNRTD